MPKSTKEIKQEEALVNAAAEAAFTAALLADEPVETNLAKSRSRFWIFAFTRIHQIPVFKRVWLYLTIMAFYTFAVDWIADQEFPTHTLKDFGTAAYTGVILGLLLVFRTNSAYERWWEGRKLWGQLTNDARNLCLKVRVCSGVPEIEKIRLGELVISFAYALKHHLRDSRPKLPLPGVGTGKPTPNNLPVHVAGQIFETLLGWEKAGTIDGYKLLILDGHAKAFMDICGGCERIRTSPLALSYRAFMRQGIALNLLALPWYIAPEIALWWSVPLILIAAYFLIGIELIAEDIEDPFGVDGDDLPLDTICSNIRNSIGEILPIESQQQFTTSIMVPRTDILQ